MRALSPDVVLAEREQRYRQRPKLRLQKEQEATHFVNDVGLCVLFPVQRMELPSLWGAIDGSTGPLPHYHDDEALAKTWRWKDTLPAQKLIYYGKLLRGKATLLALDLLPSFYALSPNFGGEADYLVEYKVGQLSREARDIYDVLLEEGALPTGELRRKAHLANRSQKYRYNRAIVELQRKLTVVKVDTTDAGPFHYSYVYDLFVRGYPDQVEAARFLFPQEARQRILQRYLDTAVVASREYLAWLFSWVHDDVNQAVDNLVEAGEAYTVAVEGWPGWYLAATPNCQSKAQPATPAGGDGPPDQ